MPPGDLGYEGDFYVDSANSGVYYGPKSAGTWGNAKPFVVPQTNYAATVPPTNGNDQTQGYAVGSVWVNNNADVQYVCTHVATNDAIWVPILPIGTIDGTVAAGDDSRIVNSLQSGTVASGDLDGTLPSPMVVSTHLNSALPIAQGGTGSTAQNFVDLTTIQTVGGDKTFTGAISVPAPSTANSAVTKVYADSIASGLSVKGSSIVATTTTLPTNTYSNGTLGVGATLTATATGALSVDGHTVALNDVVLVKNEAATANNGLYLCTTAGAGGVAYVLTRTTGMDQATEIPGAYSFVTTGSVNADTGWIVTGAGPYVIGTTAITWTQFSSTSTINAGTGLTQVGNTISLTTPVAQANLPAATTSVEGIVQLAGDLAGNAAAPTVAKINGVAVSGTAAAGKIVIGTGGTTASWQTPFFGSTGSVSGGIITVNGSNPAAFDITQVTGVIADYTTNPASPTITPVTVAAQTVVITGTPATRTLNWWLADSSGTIFAQQTTPTNTQRRQSLLLGATGSAIGTGVIFNIVVSPTLVTQTAQTTYDLINALGVFKVSGNAITANGANLSINKAAGTTFSPSANYANSTTNPNVVINPAEAPCTFFYVTQIAGSVSAATTVLNPAVYDVGGTVTSVGGSVNSSTIQRVWLYNSGVAGAQLVVQYGQTVYSSLANAVAAIGNSATFIIDPDIIGTSTLIGYVAMTRTCASLLDTTNAAVRITSKFAIP